MKVAYTGRQQELTPPQRKKIETKFAKLAKLLDRKGEREAHVILTVERHLHRAEITLPSHDHPMVGIGSSGDLFQAITAAIDKLEKQVIKLRAKWRDTKRGPKRAWEEEAPAETVAAAAAEIQSGDGLEKRVFRVNRHQNRKPMTLEEALLEMEQGRDYSYLVYRDAETDRLSVLVRRRDGHFDLIEA